MTCRPMTPSELRYLQEKLFPEEMKMSRVLESLAERLEPDSPGDEEAFEKDGIEATLWFAARPPAVKEMVRKYPPGLYRLHGNNCRLVAYSEDDDGSCTTCRVVILHADNPQGLVMEREVFGVAFTDLTPVKPQ